MDYAPKYLLRKGGKDTMADNLTIEIWDLDLEYLCALFPLPTGVIWRNQVGGVGCYHPTMEGILVPLPVKLEYCDPLMEERPPNTYRPELVQKFLKEHNIQDSFHPLTESEAKAFGHYLAEAWVPVKVLESAPFEALSPFVGRPCILTYQNSD